MNLGPQLEKAKTSRFQLWKLNFILARGIPFNNPHSIKIAEITDSSLKVHLPYKRANWNHLRGLHACALATAAEFASGIFLLSKLGDGYRIIMKSLHLDYVYQGKMDAHAHFSLPQAEIEAKVLQPLAGQESILLPCTIPVHDVQGNLLCTAVANWQVKSWSKVKTAV